MSVIVVVWLGLAIHVVYGASMTITISSNGSSKDDCCKSGSCMCSSLSSALNYTEDYTVINIVSNITLDEDVEINNLNNITITGNDVTIMCNNIGFIYFESCSNVFIMGITWYQCGTVNNNTLAPALSLYSVTNVLIYSCTFQNSPFCAVYMRNASNIVEIKGSDFIYTVGSLSDYPCVGLAISESSHSYVSVYDSKFDSNGYGLPNSSDLYSISSAIIDAVTDIVIKNTTFSCNYGALFINPDYGTKTELSNVTVFNNTVGGILLGKGDEHTFSNISISLSVFTHNVNALTIYHLPPDPFASSLPPTISLDYCVFINNKAVSNNDSGITTNSGILSIYYYNLYSVHVTISHCHFYNNFNGAIDMLSMSASQITCAITQIAFTNVTIDNTTINNIGAGNATVSIKSVRTSINLSFTNVSFTLNRHSRHSGEVLRITNFNEECSPNNFAFINLSSCTFDDNIAYDHIVALKIIRSENDQYSDVRIHLSGCNFNGNTGGNT